MSHHKVIRYGDPDTQKVLGKLIAEHGRRFPAGHIVCSLPDCSGWVRHTSKYCTPHMERMKQQGHPRGSPISFTTRAPHMIYARMGLSLIQKIPEGREAVERVLELIREKLRASYDHLPRNPYNLREWSHEEAIAHFYCNLAEQKVDPVKVLQRVTAILVAHNRDMLPFYSQKHLRFALSRAVILSAPLPLKWSHRHQDWIRLQRIPKAVLEHAGEWALHHMAPIEHLIENNHSPIMVKMVRYKKVGETMKHSFSFNSKYRTFRFPNGDLLWRGRRVTPQGLTHDPLSGGFVSVQVPPDKLVKEAECSVGAARNHRTAKVVTRETVSNPPKG